MCAVWIEPSIYASALTEFGAKCSASIESATICSESIESSAILVPSTTSEPSVSTPVSAKVASPDMTLSIHVDVPVSYNSNEPSAADVMFTSLSSARVFSLAICAST